MSSRDRSSTGGGRAKRGRADDPDGRPLRIYSLRQRNEVDIGEFNVTEYFRARNHGQPLTALPIYPHRRFRHGYYFVNTAAGIREPGDLIGGAAGSRGGRRRPACGCVASFRTITE